MVYERGNPGRPDISGKYHEPVHQAFIFKGRPEPVCRNGAWNLLYTYEPESVTCSACKRCGSERV